MFQIYKMNITIFFIIPSLFSENFTYNLFFFCGIKTSWPNLSTFQVKPECWSVLGFFFPFIYAKFSDQIK